MESDLALRMSTLEDGTSKLFKVVFQRLDEIEDRLAPQLTPNRKKIGLTEN